MSALKLVFLSLFLTLTFLVLPPAAQAAAQDLTAQNYNYFLHGQATVEGSLGHTFLCTLAGVSPLNKCLGYQKQGDTGKPIVMDRLPSGGAIGQVGSVMMAMYNNPPISSTYYLARMGEDIGIIPKTAYAQNLPGSGAGILGPVLTLWQAARNITYLLFIFIFLAVGLMIMFRQKINPQTVVTAQQALPSLVIGLILVTFSYFIASLLVDLSFVGMQLVAQLFITSKLDVAIGDPAQLAQKANILQLFGSVFFNFNTLGTVYSGVASQIGNLFGGPLLVTFVPAVLGTIVGLFTLGLPGALLGVAGATASPAIIPTIIIVVLLIALFVQLFRLLFAVLSAYITILVMTVAGPLFILVGSIPGRGGTISTWWRTILANCLIFPAVFAAFLFAGVILGNNGWTDTTPLLPFFGGIDSNFIRALIAFGIILGTPAIPGMVKTALGVKDIQGIPQAALAGIGAGLAVGRNFGGRLTQPYALERKSYQEQVLRSKAGTWVGPGGVPTATTPWYTKIFNPGT